MEKQSAIQRLRWIIPGVILGLFLALPVILDMDWSRGRGEPQSPDVVIEEEAVSLHIVAVGDVMIHQPQIAAQYQGETGTYSFDNNFAYLRPYVEQADLALCNLETTFAGGKYTGYPTFNSPESLADGLKTAGFDVAITSNNHILDRGVSGMKRTLDICRSAGLSTAGTQLEGEKNYLVTKVNNVNIGIVAYTYETPSPADKVAINSSYVPEEAVPLFNTFDYDTLAEDLEEIQQTIQAARADGAELIICYFHWGEEYQRSPNDYQLHMARQAVKFGADVIFASHPHVLQGVEMLEDEITGKKVPVFYSMGNFISNQRAETLDNRYTEQGMLADVRLEYMKSTQQIVGIRMGVLPTWVDKYRSGGKDIYTIIPLDGDLENNAVLKASGHLSRAKQAWEDVKTMIGEDLLLGRE